MPVNGSQDLNGESWVAEQGEGQVLEVDRFPHEVHGCFKGFSIFPTVHHVDLEAFAWSAEFPGIAHLHLHEWGYMELFIKLLHGFSPIVQYPRKGTGISFVPGGIVDFS